MNIIKELQCRTDAMEIAALVDDYGIEVKAMLLALRCDGKVRLIACGSLVMAAAAYGETLETYKTKCIDNGMEIYTQVELRG